MIVIKKYKNRILHIKDNGDRSYLLKVSFKDKDSIEFYHRDNGPCIIESESEYNKKDAFMFLSSLGKRKRWVNINYSQSPCYSEAEYWNL
ncbi:MAG: hypothetical protein AABY22_20420 [Nanoarchaeota archaeon]